MSIHTVTTTDRLTRLDKSTALAEANLRMVAFMKVSGRRIGIMGMEGRYRGMGDIILAIFSTDRKMAKVPIISLKAIKL